MAASSSGATGRNRGSSSEAKPAQWATTLAKGSSPGSCPMQPRKREPRCNVTNAPPGWHRSSSATISDGCSPCTAAIIAPRAIWSSSFFCRSPSDGILRFLFGLDQDSFVGLDRNAAIALLNARVDLAPEHLEVMHGGADGAQHNQPHQN